jgi:hypothetical protein
LARKPSSELDWERVLGVPVVIAGYGEDRCGILHVGLVELFVVEGALPVEVHEVPEVVKERRCRVERCEVALHCCGDVLLKIQAAVFLRCRRRHER